MVKKSEILSTISTNHSPVFCSVQKIISCTKVQDIYNSLVSNENYIQKIKQHIQQIKENFSVENQFCDQMKWEILKFEIPLFTIKFSKK